MIRIIDFLVAILILVCLSPLIILISILILLNDGLPIIYKQSRVGFNGRKFKIFKFRTMSRVVYKNEESRLSSFGKFLRKTSLDEIPQFINVIKKDMSIVGPRPLPIKIENKINKFARIKRRKIYPGITGLSQINFTGRNRKLSEKINLDLILVDNFNLYNYFRILIRTPFVLIIRFLKNKSSIIK
tara:strand:- start:446 stop:1003 length:558 start_codon:yes stop_codon:yes gene_type:complete